MQLVEGASLQERLRQGPLPPKEAAGLVAELARGVHYAHHQGVVHRDIKPDNVLLGARPLLTDFGLARDTHFDRTRMTRTGYLLGTPNFMPPEQANGSVSQIDARSDVYSLGATLYACLTGRPPVEGESTLQVLQAVLEGILPPPSRLCPEVDRELDAICLRALSRQRDDRYPTAEALAEALEAWSNTAPPPAASRATLSMAVGVVLAGVAVTAALLIRGPRPPAPSASTPPLAPPTGSPASTPASPATPLPTPSTPPPTADVTALLAEARGLLDTWSWDEALALLDEAESVAPQDPGLHAVRSLAYLSRQLLYRHGDPLERARAAADEATRLDPTLVEAWGLTYLSNLHGEGTGVALERLRALAPDSAWTLLCEALEGKRELFDALAKGRLDAHALNDALEEQVLTRMREALPELASVPWARYYYAVSPTAGLEALNVLANESGQAEASRQRQREIWERGRVELERLRDENPDDPVTWLAFGWSFKECVSRSVPGIDRVAHLQTSLAAYDRVLQLTPNSSGTLLERAWARFMLAQELGRAHGRLDPQALATSYADLERLRELDFEFSHSLWVAGLIYQRSGELETAADVYGRLLERSPDHLDGLTSLTACLMKLKRYEEVCEQTDRLFEIQGQDAPFGHLYRGAALARLGRDDDARPYLERAMVLLPPNHPARRQAAGLLAELHRRRQ
jgi:tetratricopeptide (TPR) repeat protein